MTSTPSPAAPTADIHQAIAAARRSEAPRWIESRYPFTYAYDFARGHADALGLDAYAPVDPDGGDWRGSRASASATVRAYAEATGQDRHDVVLALADAYLDEHGYDVPEQDRATRLQALPRPWWK